MSSNRVSSSCSGRRLLPALGVFLTASIGAAWTAPVAVDLNTTAAVRFDTSLSMAAGSGATRGAVWASASATTDTRSGVFFSRSGDGGVTWSQRRDLSNINSLPLGSWGNQPCLASDGALTWVAAWDACQVSGGQIQTDRDLYFRRSTDAGLNWSAPAILNSNAANVLARNYGVSLATDRAGRWVAAWESERTNGDDQAPNSFIKVARSTDNAQSWPTVRTLDLATSAAVNRNAHLAANGTGTWIVAWDSKGTGDTDIRYCRSTDHGASWSPGAWLNTTSTSDNSSPLFYDGNVRLACNGGQVWVAVWISNYAAGNPNPVSDRVVYARSTNGGVSWSAPADVDPTTVVGRSTRMTPDVVWTGEAFAVVWARPGGLQAGISTNNGASWSGPVSVVMGAGGGSESRPRLAAGAGNVRIAGWVHRPAGGTGPDILSSRNDSAAAAENAMLFW